MFSINAFRLFFLINLFSFSSLFAQEYELAPVLHISKQGLSSTEMTSSHTVLTKEQIESQPSLTLADTLKQIPGIEIAETGVGGGESSVFIRGSEARHTLILIDGFRIFDPTSIGRTLNTSTLKTLDIERIEILKGAQSVLYGSDAIGGVINIVTKKHGNKNHVQLETGAYDLIGVNQNISLEQSHLGINGFYQQVNHQNDVSSGNEDDTKMNKGMTINYSGELGSIEWESLVKYNEAFSEADKYDFINYKPIDDDAAYGDDKNLFLGQKITKNLTKTNSISFDFSTSTFKRWNKYDGFSGYTTDFYEGENHQLDLRYLLEIGNSKHSLGYFLQEETYKDQIINEKSLSINEIYYLLNYQFLNHVVDFGLRGSSNKYFGDHLLYQAGFRKNFQNQKFISLNTKTAYKAPSLYQQRAPESGFGPIGNENLAPEKSHYLELSYGKMNSSNSWEAALFYNEVEDFIDFDNGYENLYKVIYKGLELSQTFNGKRHSFNSGLTLLHFSRIGEREIQKRPNFSLKSSYGNKISDTQSIQFAWSWKGRRFEYIGGEREELKAFDTLDFSHVWSKGDIQFKSSLKNVFDRDYELVKGYETLGRTLHFELRFLY